MRQKRESGWILLDGQLFLISRTKIQMNHSPPVMTLMKTSNRKLWNLYLFLIRFPLGWVSLHYV
jgi:hypothetical protein